MICNPLELIGGFVIQIIYIVFNKVITNPDVSYHRIANPMERSFLVFELTRLQEIAIVFLTP